jgi:hypothetical protein
LPTKKPFFLGVKVLGVTTAIAPEGDESSIEQRQRKNIKNEGMSVIFVR